MASCESALYKFTTRSIWKMSGPFATVSRRYIAIHQVSLLSHASYSYSAGGVRCPRWHRQRQRMTEGTAMAPWNGPNNSNSNSSNTNTVNSNSNNNGSQHPRWLILACHVPLCRWHCCWNFFLQKGPEILQHSNRLHFPASCFQNSRVIKRF